MTTTESYRSGLYRMKSFWKPSVLLILEYYDLCAIRLLSVFPVAREERIAEGSRRESSKDCDCLCPEGSAAGNPEPQQTSSSSRVPHSIKEQDKLFKISFY